MFSLEIPKSKLENDEYQTLLTEKIKQDMIDKYTIEGLQAISWSMGDHPNRRYIFLHQLTINGNNEPKNIRTFYGSLPFNVGPQGQVCFFEDNTKNNKDSKKDNLPMVPLNKKAMLFFCSIIGFSLAYLIHTIKISYNNQQI